MKLNFMKIEAGTFKWKQIEHKDGLTFMRMKQRTRKVFYDKSVAQ